MGRGCREPPSFQSQYRLRAGSRFIVPNGGRPFIECGCSPPHGACLIWSQGFGAPWGLYAESARRNLMSFCVCKSGVLQ